MTLPNPFKPAFDTPIRNAARAKSKNELRDMKSGSIGTIWRFDVVVI